MVNTHTTKRVLITGASEGLGRLFAIRFADLGYSVVAVARNEDRLRDLVPNLKGGGHEVLVADLSSDAGVQRVRKYIERTKVEVLVNNAGFGCYGDFDKAPMDKLLEMTRLNCEALTSLSHCFLQTAVSGDSLINVASTASFQAIPYSALYAATKAYVLSLTEALSFEVKSRNIYVLALCPGPTVTEFAKRAGITNLSYKKLAQSAEEVVDAAMNAFEKRSPTVLITGVRNKMAKEIQRFFPRSTVVSLAGRMFDKFLKGSGGTAGLNKD